MLRYVSALLYGLLLVLFIITAGSVPVYAQIDLENLQPFELEVSEETDVTGSNHWMIDFHDESVASLFGVDLLQPDQDSAGYFQLHRSGGSYLMFRPEDTSERVVMRFQLNNESAGIIEQIRIMMDVATMTPAGSSSELRLSYRTDSGQGSGTLLQTGSYNFGSGEWQNTSFGTRLDTLFLATGESIELTITYQSHGSGGQTGLVALNRLEFIPVEFEEPDPLSIGDLIITEIFPGGIVENENLYYIELYNSTFEPVHLQGLEIRTGEETHRIRRPLVVEPYQMAVLANRQPDLPGLMPDMILPDLRLPEHGGMIEVIQGGDRIFRAAYDRQEGGRAWELTGVLSVMDGYAGLQDYQRADQRLSAELNGSPGSPGNTRRLFSREIGDGGRWRMVGAPGLLISSIRNGSYMNIGDENQNLPVQGGGLLTSVEPEERSERWLATEPASSSTLEVTAPAGEWILLANPFETAMYADQIVPVGGEFSGRTVQIWDETRQAFQLLHPDELIEPWQAFLIQNRDASSIRFEREIPSRDLLLTDSGHRTLTFHVRKQEGGEHPDILDMARLYFHESGTSNKDPLDAEKLWPVFDHTDRNLPGSVLYFVSQGDQDENLFLAQNSRPLNPDRFQISLGHISLRDPGAHVLSWDHLNLPDEWDLVLTDMITGESHDMKEKNEIVFDAVNLFENMQNKPEFTEQPVIRAMEGGGYDERFTLSVTPASQQAEPAQETEQRDRMELMQNYPNPFSMNTNISFFLPEQQSVVLSIYNVVGQRVAQLLDGPAPAGLESVQWDASELPSGIYIIYLESGSRVLTRKMTLIR